MSKTFFGKSNVGTTGRSRKECGGKVNYPLKSRGEERKWVAWGIRERCSVFSMRPAECKDSGSKGEGTQKIRIKTPLNTISLRTLSQ